MAAQSPKPSERSTKPQRTWQTSRWLPAEVRTRPLDKGPNGLNLCRWCREEVPTRRHSYCSANCVHEWNLRVSNSYLRTHVYRRDKGICCRCRMDTKAVQIELRALSADVRRLRLAAMGLTEKRLQKSLWEGDHILPVSEGGGCCGLENMRTLCFHCHRLETARLRKRLTIHG